MHFPSVIIFPLSTHAELNSVFPHRFEKILAATRIFPTFSKRGKDGEKKEVPRLIEYCAAQVKAVRYCEAADGISGDCPGNVVRAHLDGRARCLYHRLPIDP